VLARIIDRQPDSLGIAERSSCPDSKRRAGRAAIAYHPAIVRKHYGIDDESELRISSD
jgi:hypothetical protein